MSKHHAMKRRQGSTVLTLGGKIHLIHWIYSCVSPRAGMDMMIKKRIPVLARNWTLVIQLTASHFTEQEEWNITPCKIWTFHSDWMWWHLGPLAVQEWHSNPFQRMSRPPSSALMWYPYHGGRDVCTWLALPRRLHCTITSRCEKNQNSGPRFCIFGRVKTKTSL